MSRSFVVRTDIVCVQIAFSSLPSLVLLVEPKENFPRLICLVFLQQVFELTFYVVAHLFIQHPHDVRRVHTCSVPALFGFFSLCRVLTVQTGIYEPHHFSMQFVSHLISWVNVRHHESATRH